MVKVVLGDITHIESLRNYVSIYLKEGKEIKTLNTMSNIEGKLPEVNFLRVHRSYIVAVDKIDAFTATSVKVAGQYIPIGRNYKDHVKQVLEQRSIE